MRRVRQTTNKREVKQRGGSRRDMAKGKTTREEFKTSRPACNGAYPRTRLFEALDRLNGVPLTWITAPAGAGKSILVSSYVEQTRATAVWYRVESGDDDTAAFFFHLNQIAGRLFPSTQRHLSAFTREFTGGHTAFARNFFRRLFAHDRGPTCWVLDDYQELTASAPLHEVVCSMAEECPRDQRLIVISREPPPPTLIRLELTCKLSFIGADELLLTAQESTEFLHHLNLDSRPDLQLQHLHDHSQGWMAALLLLARSPTRHGAPEALLSVDSRRQLFDFLVHEVFMRMEPALRRFLATTARLPKFDLQAARVVSGDPNAESHIERLLREHYFIALAQGETAVFEYHPLLREFLLNDDRVTADGAVTARQLSEAAELLEREGLPEAAIEVWREAQDWASMSLALSKHADVVIKNGRYLTLKRWLDLLPGSELQLRPWLLYWQGMCLLAINPKQALPCFEAAHAAFDQDHDDVGMHLSTAGAIEAVLFAYDDLRPLDHWLEQLRLTRERFPRPPLEVQLRTTAIAMLAVFVRFPGRWRDSWLISIGEVLYRSVPLAALRVSLGGPLGMYYLLTGARAKADALVRMLKPALLSGKGGERARLIACMALVYYDTLTMSDSSEDFAELGTRIAEQSGIHEMDHMLGCYGVYALIMRRDYTRAKQRIDALIARTPDECRMHSSHNHMLAAWLASEVGAKAEALEHATIALEQTRAIGLPLGQCVGGNLVAQLACEHGDAETSARAAAEATQAAQQMDCLLMDFQCACTEAWLALRNDREPALRRALSRAFEMGERAEIFGHSCWRTEVMTGLCHAALRHGIHTDYAKRLVRRHGFAQPQDDALADWPWPVRIRSLGGFSVLINDRPLRFGRKAQRRVVDLLQAIVALGGVDVDSGLLSSLLWPDSAGDDANKALEINLHRLRKLLGKETVQTSNGRLSLNPERCHLDTWALQDELRRLQQSLHNGADSEQIALLAKRVLEYYHGPLLADANWPWILETRRRLRSRFLNCLEQAGSALLQCERWTTAAELLEGVINTEPEAEFAYRGLMQAHHALGRYVDAAHVYRHCLKLFREHFGVPLSPQTEALAQELSLIPSDL